MNQQLDANTQVSVTNKKHKRFGEAGKVMEQNTPVEDTVLIQFDTDQVVDRLDLADVKVLRA